MRVIAGRFKGRRLKAPSWDGLRPTSDKLRETLFNILTPFIEDARVLDGFAGTGAVGIEALSRGAAHVTFIESDRRAAALLEENLSACEVKEGFALRCGAILRAFQEMPATDRFTLILLDPPYETPGISEVLAAAAPHLTPDGVIVLERATRRPAQVPDILTITREVKSGDSTLTFLAHA